MKVSSIIPLAWWIKQTGPGPAILEYGDGTLEYSLATDWDIEVVVPAADAMYYTRLNVGAPITFEMSDTPGQFITNAI